MRSSLALLSVCGVAAFVACSTGNPASPEPLEASASFAAETPAVYVAKVKNILVGLPPTDAEVKAVEADPAALDTLIGGWMQLPQYSEKMLRFFELAFQQTQVSITDFADQVYPRQADSNGTTIPLLVQNATESFARTVQELITEGRPFTDTVTTQSFMMTPALMELYAFLDAYQVNDAGQITDAFKNTHPTVTLYAEAAGGPIAITDTLNPSSPDYMHWYDPDVAKLGTYLPAGCVEDPVSYPSSALTLHLMLLGALDLRKDAAGDQCAYGGSALAPQLTTSDFTSWKMVTIRPPVGTEATTDFFDLPTLRSTSELVLKLPRVGFFTTPAFFANWQTNTSNQMRVTMNQTLIVATGAQVDGTDTTVPPSTPGLDPVHSAPGSACLVCHQLLDPTRSILSATYSWNYHTQTDPTLTGQPGLFAFQGVVTPVTSVTALASTLATHPLLPAAWVQKLCYYANSEACQTTDPEFQRLVGVFKSSGYSWNALVRALFGSPLVTYASPTATSLQSGEVVAVSRRDALCAALDDRLGLNDVCALDALSQVSNKTTVPLIVSGLPSDGYGRGAVAPVLPNQPTLFYRAGTENICEAVAAQVIDAPSPAAGVMQWSSTQATPAIADFVQTVMALTPSDERYAAAVMLLQSHYTAAVKSGATASNALKSTFVAACMAPSAITIGL
jgi:hypothetical protein